MLEQAIEIALSAHRGQIDKGGMLYILHPLYVMSCVDEIDTKIVAVLHDVVEDTNITLEYLSEHFSKTIVDAIGAITHRKGESNKEYWKRVKANPLALQVKLADIAHNSSEKRLAALSKEEQEYLRGKYKAAIEFLTSP
jgi:(p)ppGpp synthase/HD superfamily hydrolase